MAFIFLYVIKVGGVYVAVQLWHNWSHSWKTETERIMEPKWPPQTENTSKQTQRFCFLCIGTYSQKFKYACETISDIF